MNNLQKTVLFWLGAAFLVVVSIFFLTSINQMANTATTTNTVSFSGEGKISAKPDVAVTTLSIVTEAATSKAAQDLNSAKSKKVVEYLKSQNIADKDIRTTGYNIYPQYDYTPCLRSSVPCDSSTKIKNYQVAQGIEVKIRNLDDASKIIDGVVTAGANQVNQLSFTIDKPEALKEQARALAIADAKAKADNLKSQLGISLGRIINFTEGSNGYPMPMYEKAMSSDSGMGGGGPSLPSGENEITVNVSITYQIK
jgi:uncharacterized protein